jgi:hypothetical protein
MVELITIKETLLLDFLFGEFKRPIGDDEDYQELGEIFDEGE